MRLQYNKSLKDIAASVFEEIEISINRVNKKNDFIKLHQGKTIFNPCISLQNWNLSSFPLSAHEHASSNGVKELIRQIAKKFFEPYFPHLSEENLLITCGATHGIEVCLKTILNPGDEVIVLSPQWLFIVGLIKSLNCYAIEAPIFIELSQNENFDFLKILNNKLTKKTKAIYFNTPNNPTGYSLDEEKIKKILFFSKKNNLWIIADNAYENYDFSDHGFIDINKFHDTKDQTLSIYTFSKTFAIPGYRVGYIVTPNSIAAEAKKRGLYSVYAVSTPSQYAAFQALNISDEILDIYKKKVKFAADIVSNNLKIPHTEIQGGFYTFLNIGKWPKGNTLNFIKKCMNDGVSLAPGIAFGDHCSEYARLCFTSVSSEKLLEGIKLLNKIYYK